MPTRVCLSCRQLTSKPSQRGLCPECQRDWEQARPARAVYDSAAWRRLSATTVAAWVRRRGWLCPGYRVPPHTAYDLTLDHPIALAQGGAPLPRRPGVLCRACNGRKAANPPSDSEAPTP